MTYFVTGAGFITEYQKLADNTATDVLNVGRPVTVASIRCTETAGSTPNLTIAVYDAANTVTYYLRNAIAMTAKESVIYNEPFVIPVGWTLRVTSSAVGGGVDVFTNYFSPDASGRAG